MKVETRSGIDITRANGSIPSADDSTTRGTVKKEIRGRVFQIHIVRTERVRL